MFYIKTYHLFVNLRHIYPNTIFGQILKGFYKPTPSYILSPIDSISPVTNMTSITHNEGFIYNIKLIKSPTKGSDIIVKHNMYTLIVALILIH